MSSDELAFTFTKGIRAGVCVMTSIGALSAFTTFLLLIYLIRVTFVQTASNFRYLPKGPIATEPETAPMRVDVPSSFSGKLTPDPPITPGSQRQIHGSRQTVCLQIGRTEKERMFLPTQLGLFIVCLLFSDFVQALGVLIQLRWLHLGGIQGGTACRMQAALLTFGDVASGIWNAVIAIHTFVTICLGKRLTTPIVVITLICGWSCPILMNVIGAVVIENMNKSSKGPYYGVAGAWCFITNAYDVERALMHYTPMLVASALITLMYIPVFLTIRGNLLITPSQSDWYKYRFTFRSASLPIATGSIVSGGSSAHTAHLRGIANKMLWYPTVYNVVLLPTVVCRFKGISGPPIPLPVILGCISLLASMGFSNVCIYVFTRNLGGAPWLASSSLAKQEVEIFVERTTVNEAGPASGGDNGGRQERANHSNLSTLGAIKFSRHDSGFCSGGDVDSDVGAKAKGVEEEELPPSPTSKYILLHDLVFRQMTPLSHDLSGLDGIRVERVGIYNHDSHSQPAFQHSLQSIHNVTPRDDPSS